MNKLRGRKGVRVCVWTEPHNAILAQTNRRNRKKNRRKAVRKKINRKIFLSYSSCLIAEYSQSWRHLTKVWTNTGEECKRTRDTLADAWMGLSLHPVFTQGAQRPARRYGRGCIKETKFPEAQPPQALLPNYQQVPADTALEVMLLLFSLLPSTTLLRWGGGGETTHTSFNHCIVFLLWNVKLLRVPNEGWGRSTVLVSVRPLLTEAP